LWPKNWVGLPFGRFFANLSGVDAMITFFCDFCQFSAKKLAFFSKTYVMIKILHNFALFWVKNANFFAEIFGENILKIITSPGHPASRQLQAPTEESLKDLAAKLTAGSIDFKLWIEQPENMVTCFATRNRFYKTPFRPKTFRTKFHPTNFGQNYTQKQYVDTQYIDVHTCMYIFLIITDRKSLIWRNF
jgi:hypothetical protein